MNFTEFKHQDTPDLRGGKNNSRNGIAKPHGCLFYKRWQLFTNRAFNCSVSGNYSRFITLFFLRLWREYHFADFLAKPGAVVRRDTGSQAAFVFVAAGHLYRHFVYYIGTYGGQLAGDEHTEQPGLVW